MLEVPTGESELLAFANEIINQCNASQGVRAAYYRTLSMIYETGRYDGTKSLINTLPNHINRLGGMLYSPVELKFSGSYVNVYPDIEINRLKQATKVLGAQWSKPGVNADVLWGRGVVDSLKYGACFLKQWVEMEWDLPVYQQKLVMPWQLGVLNEAENDLNKQDAITETSRLTLPEVWKRIAHLPGARQMYESIKSNAGIAPQGSEPDSFFHTVLSTSQLQTGVNGGGSMIPGGIVQINQNPNYAMMGPVVAAPTVKFHEIWVKGDDDYITIQMVGSDILVTKFKNANLLGLKRKQPYRIIQPNEISNYIWGRSELVDLIEPQGLLSVWCDDLKRLYGLQVDKILAFSGGGGITDEMYGQFRAAGYMSLTEQAKVEDLTPKIPPEALPLLRFVLEIINTIAGFPPVMQGQGDSGVRAGVQLNTLMKTASPTQRDRALLVERQLADAASLSFEIMRAKNAKFYWTDGSSPEKAEDTKFLLAQIPEDYQIIVDSHSSSPIFSDENAQLIFQARKIGDVGAEYMLDNLPFPNKDVAKAQLKQKQEAQAAQQKQMLDAAQQMPVEVQGKILEGQFKKK